ncbi:MAG: hypothetical protein PHY47_12805 [Lachnospiraceae bacterium]|nr:hypothetical protein [Lachnospiraceae bacterium]
MKIIKKATTIIMDEQDIVNAISEYIDNEEGIEVSYDEVNKALPVNLKSIVIKTEET